MTATRTDCCGTVTRSLNPPPAGITGSLNPVAVAADVLALKVEMTGAGVGKPHVRSALQLGETVVDPGSGAGVDAISASWAVGASGKVIGCDLNFHSPPRRSPWPR